MNRRNAILLFGILAIVCVIAIVAAAESADRGTRAGETYLGDPSSNCGCHPTKIANWTETQHADPDDDFKDKTSKGAFNSSCTPCHVVGYNEIAADGFDPGQAWNSSFNMDRWTIQCENCHGPASGHNGNVAGINIDRDPYTACQGTEFAECHGGERQWGTDEIPGWNASIHGPNDDDPLTDDHEAESRNSYCARCKDPSNFDPTSSRNDNDPVPYEDYRGISCGDCHNPHNETGHIAQLKWDEEEVCDACHNGGHHETMRTKELDSTPSVDREDYPYMDEVSCVECHMFGTGHGTPEPYVVQGHSFMPRTEACVECHTDVYDEMPDVDYDEGNATAMAEWDDWNETLQEALEEWGEVVEASQERHDELLEEVTELVEEVEEIMEVAEVNGTWTEDLQDIFDQAEYDWELADHASRGAHNPAYATALLNSAKEAFEGILDELSEGYIKGWVTDEDNAAISGAYIIINGHGTKTDSNGMYMIMIEPGTYDVSAFIPGTEEKTATGITIHAAQVITQNFTLAPDFDRDGTADETDTDDDNDGVLDANDAFDDDPTEWTDTDGDGIGNNEDTDDDGDGVLDTEDSAPLDATITKKIGEGEKEEADNTMYLIIIVVLIVVIIIVAVMGAKKGGSAPAPPREEPMAEEPEDEMPEDEEEEEL